MVKLLDWELFGRKVLEGVKAFLTKANPCHQHVHAGPLGQLLPADCGGVLVHGEVLVGHHGVRLSLADPNIS